MSDCSKTEVTVTALADLQSEFNEFRQTTTRRLAHLERVHGLSSGEDFLGGNMIVWLMVFAVILSLLPMILPARKG